MEMNKKIIVIGSGASGIAAATRLHELGFKDFIVLEAESRIGGRIHTVPFGENVLDLGAQWCHGQKDNVVYELATKYANDIFDSTGKFYKNFICVKSNKEVVPQYISRKLNGLIEGIFEDEEMQKYKGSIGEYLTTKYSKALETPEYSDIDKKTAKQFYEFFCKFETSLDACDTLYDISAATSVTYWECQGDPLLNWKGKGYVTVLRILIKSTPENPLGILKNKILLNKKVKTIHWKPNEGDKVAVECDNGEKYYADHVICTASLGVLKEKHSSLFYPTLPTLKLRAIEGLGFGNVDKMFIEFPNAFWPEGWSGICLLWEDEDLNEIRKRDDKWIEDVFSFHPIDLQPNILCGWIVGANGRRMEAKSDADVQNSLLYLLKKFLPWEIPKPKSFIRSTWYLNQNFRGSYSFRSMRTEELDTKPADLAYPLIDDFDGKPMLMFAGEATHDHYYSTVHGAIESGWREAKRLNDYYNKNKSHI